MIKRILLWLWKNLPMTSGMRFLAMWILNQKFLLGVVGVVVDEAGRVLLLNHVYREEYPWGLPSGWVRRNEQPQAAIVREIWEEAGLEVEVLSVLDVRISTRVPRIDLTLLCRPVGSTEAIRANDAEISDAGFFAEDDMPQVLFDPQPELIRKALAEIQRWR